MSHFLFLGVHIGTANGETNVLLNACNNAKAGAGANLNIGLASIKFTDSTYGLYPFFYHHTVELTFGSRLAGNGNIGSNYNKLGTISNCSSVTVLLLGLYAQ